MSQQSSLHNSSGSNNNTLTSKLSEAQFTCSIFNFKYILPGLNAVGDCLHAK